MKSQASLIVVESPTKARTLERFLGKGFSVEATSGHIKDLPKSTLGVDIENNFKPQYELLSKRQETIEKLKVKSQKSEVIYIATDPDREGEAIAQHVKEILRGKTFRIVFHEITKEAVEDAIASPRNIDENLVDAQVARRVLDRLVGYKLSPLLWRKVRRGLSAGRVQSVAVRLIVEREREIDAFKLEEYWEIFAKVKPTKPTPDVGSADTSGVFVVQLIKVKIVNKEQADKVVLELEKAKYKVLDVKKREVVKNPYPPFTTSTLAQAGARIFGWSAKRTMSIAQRLYEGGLITYHRTDSCRIALQAISKVRNFIKKEFGDKYLPEKPRFYRTKSKVAQEAHEAIRPTDVTKNPTSGVGFGSLEVKKLYDLIWKRFVACQMAASVYGETVIDVEACFTPVEAKRHIGSGRKDSPDVNYFLRASGQVMKFDGWKKLYIGTSRGGGIDSREVVLPDVQINDPLQLIEVLPEQKFTQPPARYTEASLIKTLEKLGIGRPSTYAPTIYTIQMRNYVEKNEGKFTPTLVGVAVNDFLVKNFPDVFDYQFTAEMENDLDEIADGKRKWVETVKIFWNPFSRRLDSVAENSKRVKIEVEKLDKECPECKSGELVIRIGRFGKFISCSRFPDCKYTERHLEKVGMKCPECKKSLPAGRQGDVIIKRSKRGRKFFGCSRYPDCKWASWRKPG